MNDFLPESIAMMLARGAGFSSLAWSLRRLHCPVEAKALVLEVGSGGNPYFRSNVLLDAHEDTRERHWERLISDRPTVLGEVERLPFKDKAFDFIIASHVLEHSKSPDLFLKELSRVGKAGYIEVPDAFMERITPYIDHRLEITERDGVLLIRKKASFQSDQTLAELYRHKAGAVIAGDTMPRFPFHFHVRHYWRDTVKFKIINPEVDAGWPAPEAPREPSSPLPLKAKLNKTMLGAIRKFFSQSRRNRSINLLDLLVCPSCRLEGLRREDGLECLGCGARYPVRDGIPDMNLRGVR